MALSVPPYDSIVALIQALVRVPSRAGEDALQPVLSCVERWFEDRGLDFTRLQGPGGQALGVYAQVQGRRDGQRWTVLDATLDTAGFGDLATWSRPPTEAAVVDGWLQGRGSADSKAGAAIFAHLLQDFAAARDSFGGRIGVLLDLDEHSGDFGGARAFFDPPAGTPPRPDGVIIGYPGIDRIVTGSRGYLRARIVVHGVAAHSGGTQQRGLNAIDRALDLTRVLQVAAAAQVNLTDSAFGLPPAFTFTRISGGSNAFSQVPDRCELGLDIRLTPAFADAHARRLVDDVIAQHDRGQAAAPTGVEWLAGWPAYRVPDGDPMVVALRGAARGVLDAGTRHGCRRAFEHRQLPGPARRAGAGRLWRALRAHPRRRRAHRPRQHRPCVPHLPRGAAPAARLTRRCGIRCRTVLRPSR